MFGRLLRFRAVWRWQEAKSRAAVNTVNRGVIDNDGSWSLPQPLPKHIEG
jgi:hypothetical protein